MGPGNINKILLSGIMILVAGLVSGQVIKKPDPKLMVDRSKSILAITPCSSGSFYMNDYYLTDISKNDTVYIFNLKPGDYSVKFVTDTSTLKGRMTIDHGKIQAISPCPDSLSLLPVELKWNANFRKMTGRTVNHQNKVRRHSFYSITQFALFNFYLNSRDEWNASFFQSFTIVNGYQVAPGFCTGLGVAYNYYPFEGMTSVGQIENVRLNFMPVFLDVRAHLPPKGEHVSPFFKFDIGYNILLYKSPIEALYSGEVTYVMNKGGIYISPGFGMRIFINDLVQIITTLEYSFEQSSFYVNNPYLPEQYIVKTNLSFLKISLGVGLQYK